jgi:aldehyde dehydrogenase (NAD+)
VQEGIYDEFVAKAAAAANDRKVAAGWEEGAAQGTQVSQEQVDIIMNYIESGTKEGATLVAGGNRVGDEGYFLEPTVFADCTDDMTIAKEEIFGPVMAIFKFKTAEEAIARANDTEYGLGAAVFTKDFQKARATVNKIRSGTVWVNCYDTFDAALPFGGFKASGIGRELGEAGLRPYLETKTVVYN